MSRIAGKIRITAFRSQLIKLSFVYTNKELKLST